MDTQDTPKPTKKASDKELGVQILRAEGLSTKAIAETMGLHPQSVYRIAGRLKKFDITGNEKKYRRASKALDSLLQGKTFGEIKEVKDSTVATLIKEVYARHDPVIQHSVSLNANVTFSKIDLSGYQGGGEDIKGVKVVTQGEGEGQGGDSTEAAE